MGRRRRSLIAGTTRRRGSEGQESDEHDDEGGDGGSFDDDASVPPDEGLPPPPDTGPPPADAEPTVPHGIDEVGHAPHVGLPEEVTETSYSAAGHGMSEDTTDSGWQDTAAPRLREPLPPPPTPLGARHRTEPREAAPAAPSFTESEPEEAATVRYPSMDEEPRRPDGIGFGGIGDFDDEEPPPTDEIPSAVLQDVSQPYVAPMSVPEPPPIPGILDRFTPVLAAQRAVPAVVGGGKNDRRPSYIADTPTPPPQLLRNEGPDRSSSNKPARARDEEGGSMMPVLFALLAVMGVAMMLAAGALGWMYLQNTAQVDVDDGPSPTELEGPSGLKVKVQQGLRPGEPEPGQDPPDPEPVEAPEPTAPSPEPTRPAPDRPTPRPQPTPTPVTPAAPTETEQRGSLVIRSNRKVLVYVDGKAIGYAPTTYKAPAGSVTVTAMLPGQPQSKQTQTISLSAGGTAPVEFTF